MEEFGEHSGYPREQKLADAKLDAAGLDLLKALQNIVDQIECEVVSEYMDEFSEQAKQAINKALN